MGFSADMADMVASIDSELGEPATWSGVAEPVQVHPTDEDDIARFGGGEVALRSRSLSVHRSAVPQPAAGNIVTLIETGEALEVCGAPTIDRDGYWLCTVRAL